MSKILLCLSLVFFSVCSWSMPFVQTLEQMQISKVTLSDTKIEVEAANEEEAGTYKIKKLNPKKSKLRDFVESMVTQAPFDFFMDPGAEDNQILGYEFKRRLGKRKPSHFKKYDRPPYTDADIDNFPLVSGEMTGAEPVGVYTKFGSSVLVLAKKEGSSYKYYKAKLAEGNQKKLKTVLLEKATSLGIPVKVETNQNSEITTIEVNAL